MILDGRGTFKENPHLHMPKRNTNFENVEVRQKISAVKYPAHLLRPLMRNFQTIRNIDISKSVIYFQFNKILNIKI